MESSGGSRSNDVKINKASFTDSKGNKISEEEFRKKFAGVVTKPASLNALPEMKPNNKNVPEFR